MAEEPKKSGQNGSESYRDAAGRFLPGNPGSPGRPRAIDLRRLAAERSAAAGIDLGDALWEVLQAMIARGRDGDVAAAKLAFDRLCDLEAQKVEVAIESAGLQPPKPTDFVEALRTVAKLADPGES